jgi:hypothetical protein
VRGSVGLATRGDAHAGDVRGLGGTVLGLDVRAHDRSGSQRDAGRELTHGDRPVPRLLRR